MKKSVSIDIDGVLNFYPEPWLDFIKIKTNILFISKKEAKKTLGDKIYSQIKDEYRTSTFKENLPINENSVLFLDKLKSNDYFINISTSRPIKDSKYPDLFFLTERWLKKQKIPFDRLLYKVDTATFYNELGPVIFHVDDEIKYAEMLSQKGIKVYLYNNETDNLNNKLIKPVQDLWQINDYESIF